MRVRVLVQVVLLAASALVGEATAQEPGGAWRSLDREARELLDAGEYPEALATARRALEAAEGELGQDHPALVPLLTRVGDAELFVGGSAEAEAAYRRALEIAESSPDPDEDELGAILFNVASILEDRGENVDASFLYWRCVALFTPTLGADHPRVELCRTRAQAAAEAGAAEAAAILEDPFEESDAPAPADPDVERWLRAMLEFYDRAPLSASYRMTMSASQGAQTLELSGEGTLIYGDPTHLRATAELEMRAPGQAEPTHLSVLVVGDGESVWTRLESPGREPQLTRMSVEEYEQQSAGLGLGGVGAGDPVAQMRALLELADLEVVEQTPERVVLRGPFNDTFWERVGPQAQLFGRDAGVTIAIVPDTGAPLFMEAGGEGLLTRMEFGNPVFHGPGSLPEDTFVYQPPEGAVAPPGRY